MITMTWITIEPVDTLFFRGADSMFAGENHEVRTVFPPMPSTICGAMRSAALVQLRITPRDYRRQPAEIAAKHPFIGIPEHAGFTISGPLFMVEDGGKPVALFPAPAHWFADYDPHDMNCSDGTKLTVQPAMPLLLEGNTLGLDGSIKKPAWVRSPKTRDLEPLAGCWVNQTALAAAGDKFTLSLRRLSKKNIFPADQPLLIPAADLFDHEQRVGIALEPTRAVKTGHLYSAAHVRLRDGVTLLVGIASEHPFCLQHEGIMQLGGEQRVCRYRVLPEFAPELPKDGKNILALAPVPVGAVPDGLSLAGGKLLRMAGWDMVKGEGRGFHKVTVSYYQAGTVFFEVDRATVIPGCVRI